MFTEDEDKSFLGRGWSFPPTFDLYSRGIHMSASEADIEESLRILLSTKPGERVMNPDYGCDLSRLLFEPLGNSLVNFIQDRIHMAILKFEPRIKFEGINIAETSDLYRNGEGIVFVKIDYTVRSTNSRSNMVYPFYKIEGTNIPIE